MTFSKENIDDIKPQKEFVSESIELDSQAKNELEGLLNLLVELKIIHSINELSHEAIALKDEKTSLVSNTVPKLEDSSSHQPPLAQEKQGEEGAIEACVNEASLIPIADDSRNLLSSEILEKPRSSSPNVSAIEQLENVSETSKAQTEEHSKELDTLIELLQKLATNTEQTELPHQLEELQQRLAKLEHQIDEPSELLNLLLPLMAKLLSLTVTQSRASVTDSLTPLIDELIHKRNQEDRVSMGEALAPAIGVAISRQVSESPEEVATAIAPEMATAIKQQIILKQDAMVDALYPIIGTTIATYIGQEIRGINQKLEDRISFEAITRKIRAKFRGVSEAELRLKEAVSFSVRAIFLIHKGSGLVISEVQPSDSQRLESEMIAGMLTAIRSFVNDCIAQSGDVAEIDAIDYGTSKIILEVAGYCYLAVVIQGEPPRSFIFRMREVLGTIVQNYGKPIEFFEGDPATIPDSVNLILERLIDESPITLTQVERRHPPALLMVSLVVLSLICVPWGIYNYKGRVSRHLEDKTVLALTSTPELSVYRINVDIRRGILQLSGRVPNQYLRLKAAQIAKATEPNLKIDNQIIAVEVPPDPVLVAAEVKRATSILNQMEGVAIASRYTEGSVTVEGTVSQVADALDITQAFKQIPGVQSVTNTAHIASLTIPTELYFDPGSAEIKVADINRKITLVKTFLNRYPEKHLRIVGQTDPSGNPAENQQLALERAKTAQDALVNQGIAPERIQLIGRAKSPSDVDADQPLWLSRSVQFELFTPILKNK